MKRKVLALILILPLAAAPAAFTQTKSRTPSTTSTQQWQDLELLRPGTKILIEFKGGLRDPVECYFMNVTGTALTVSQDTYQVRLDQHDIQRIFLVKNKISRDTAVDAGMAIGMVTGTVIGVHRSISSHKSLASAFVGFFIGTAAGAGAGALIAGMQSTKGKLLYDAK